MNGETIKSFLVGLGFDVDEASLSNFNRAIFNAGVKVTALYGSIQLLSTGVFAGLSMMSQSFEDVGYQLRLVAPAINKMLILRQAMISAYQAAGINLTKAVQQSILFNFSLAKTKFALEAVYKSVGIKFLPLLTQQMEKFRQFIFANLPKIQGALTSFVNGVYRAFMFTVTIATRAWSILESVIGFFKQLDDATDGWSTKILGLIAVWKILNLSFLATPFGLVLAGIVALIALYDDFKVWEEGGKAFVDWGGQAGDVMRSLRDIVTAFIPAIKEFAQSLKPAGDGSISDALKEITIAQLAWYGIMALNPFGDFKSHVSGIIKFLAVLAEEFIYLKWIEPWLTRVMDKIKEWYSYGKGAVSTAANFLGSPNAFGAVGAATGPSPLSQYYQFGGNQSVSQKTDIHVQSTADAWGTAMAISSQQERTNFDMTRNLKGAMK